MQWFLFLILLGWVLSDPVGFVRAVCLAVCAAVFWLAVYGGFFESDLWRAVVMGGIIIFVVVGSAWVFCIPYIVWKNWPKTNAGNNVH